MSSESDARVTTNLGHRQYEQVRKDKVYNLAEQDCEKFETDHRLESLSLRQLLEGDAAAVADFSERLVRGLADIGFVYLTDHGVDPALFEDAHRRTRELFETTPTQVRRRFLAERHGSVNQGYFPHKKTTRLHPDLVEGWVFASRAFAVHGRSEEEISSFWPAPRYERFFRRVYLALEPLALPLMRAILTRFRCPRDLYDRRLHQPLAALRLNYYPAMSEEDECLEAARLLGHEDVTLFTFLPSSPVEGLQVFHKRTGRWIRLTPAPDTLVLNAGDYLQRITNDTLQSSTHRVSPPRDPVERRAPRTSFPLFVYLREEDRVEVLPSIENPRYESVQALEFHTSITRKFYGDDYPSTGTDA